MLPLVRSAPHSSWSIRTSYVDGFVLVVPTKNLPAYIRMATKGAKIWREHGALEYRECSGDDLDVKMGLPFSKLLKLKDDETAEDGLRRIQGDRGRMMTVMAMTQDCRNTP